MIGGGYVGLVSGACFAEFGVEVAVVETEPGRLAALRAGQMPIYEPGLSDLVAQNVAAGRLSFGDDLGVALAEAEAVFLAVGTPTRRGGNSRRPYGSARRPRRRWPGSRRIAAGAWIRR